MRKHLRTTAAAVGLLLSVSLTTQAFAVGPFTDITKLDSKAQIEALQSKGIIRGVTATSFHPEDSLTAAQGISLIVRTTQLSLAAISFPSAPMADDYYTKVSNDAWYAEDFVIAHHNGLDIPADIDPKAELTKEQFVHYLVQAVELTGQYPLIKMYIHINDEQDITPEYQGTIQRALLYKFAALNEEGNFEPEHVLTRAEAAAMLYQADSFIEGHKEAAIEEPEVEIEEQPDSEAAIDTDAAADPEA